MEKYVVELTSEEQKQLAQVCMDGWRHPNNL